MTSLALLLGIKNNELRPIEVMKEDVPDEDVLDVIHRCLVYDPEKRITFKDIERRLSDALENCKQTKQTKQTNQNDVSVGGSKNYGGLQSLGNLV